ncbi:MAG TPA: retropepsin-like aspartic protease [Patescibacteria group bacterium]|nr:retropepsin-like aspartic protease [Patescibacteria group bacterium]
MQDFQALTTKYGGRTNVLVGDVQISQAFDIKSDPINHKPLKEIKAIWDTGASCTVITKKLAAEIGLIPTGKEIVSGIDHDSPENTFFVNVYLPNKVCMMNLKIVEVPSIKSADLLIGMDIIGAGDFSIFIKDGKTVMSYRYPSIGGMDFVEEAGSVNSQRAILNRIEEQKSHRKALSRKELQKRINRKKNKKQNRRKKH